MRINFTACGATLLAGVLLLGGCGLGQPASGQLASAAFGEPLTVGNCTRSYRNEVLGFGFNPPPDSKGPDVQPASENGQTLFVGMWKSPTNRIFRVSVVNIGTTSFDEAIQNGRQIAAFRGMSVLDDRPIGLDSGRVGWLLKVGSRGGTSEMNVFDMRRGYLFAISIDISGITSAELDKVNQVLKSFCVDP